MRLSEFPFTLELLIGAKVEWIPFPNSDQYSDYIAGRRWYYKIVAVRGELAVDLTTSSPLNQDEKSGAVYHNYENLNLLSILEIP
jgi:hypothetical protein